MDAEEWVKKGNDLYLLGRYQEALEAFEGALSGSPDYAPAWNNKGLTLYILGRYQEAVDSYAKAL